MIYLNKVQSRTHRFATVLALFMVAGASFVFAVEEAAPKKEEKVVQLQENTELNAQGELPEHIDPNQIRRGIPMGGRDGKSREQLFFERVIAKVEPSLKGSVERLDQYIALFQRELINDTRIFPTHIEATWDDAEQAVRLAGWVGYREHHRSLLKLFQFLGFDKVVDAVEILPSDNLGAEKYAVVTVPFCFSRDAQGEEMTQSLLGDSIFLLRKMEDGTFLSQSRTGYVGFVDTENIQRMDAAAFAEYNEGDRVVFNKDLTGPDGLIVPIGARLKASQADCEDLMAVLPSGEEVKATEVGMLQPNAVPEKILNAIEVIKGFEGVPYSWGGNTRDGVDCSGVIQTGFRSQGINLPRDASQQMYLGTLVATRWNRDGLRPGDTVYFLSKRSGKVSHTGIYVGDDLFFEATGPHAKFTSFDPESPDYSEFRTNGFAFGKRLLD